MREKSVAVCFIVMAALALLAMTTAGCGEESSGPGGQTSAAQPPAQKQDDKGIGDACEIVTQADATALFGKSAVKEKGVDVLDPSMTGECLWTWDSETSNQLLQFRVWNGPQYYSEMPGAQPLDVGEKGFISVNSWSGVDIGWIQDGKTVELSYSTVGGDAPEPETKVEEMKQLARKVEGKL